ncbi:MAG TPA: hypothetical protein VIY48_13180 [Candidatus Paceibacterota bacterium]
MKADEYHEPETFKDGEKVEPVVEAPTRHNSIHGEAVFNHRFGVFMRAGFGPVESEALAHSREDTHRVRKMLDHGCSIEQAVIILL